MKNSKAISIIKNFPSNDISKEDKKEALSILVSTNIVDKLTKNELYNAIIYLSDMVDFNREKMDEKTALKVLKTERECVSRNDGGNCDRDCGKCDLVLPSDVVLQAYDYVIAEISKTLKETKEHLKYV